MSTSTSHKGDSISALVLQPDAFRGDVMQGHITESRAGNRGSTLNFNFDTLIHAGTLVPVASTVTSITNSKGQANVDESGNSVTPASAAAKAAAGSGFRSAVGGLAGRLGNGGAAGQAAGAGVEAAAGVIQIEVTTPAPRIEFAKGSQVALTVKSRNGGPSLSNLAPNVPTASAAPQSGGTAPAGDTMAASGGAPAMPASGGAMPAAAAGGSAPASAGQPQFSTVRIDFVPGERTEFYDDFSDMVPDEPPPHWKVRENPVELHTGADFHELWAKDHVQLTSPPFPGTADYTFELDFTGQGQTGWSFRDKDDHEVVHTMVRGEPDGSTVNISVDAKDSGTLGSGTMQGVDLKQPQHFALWVQRGRVRAYINGTRVLDVNQVNVPAPDHISADISGYRPNGIRLVRVAEAAPDFSTVIGNTGKYVSHGIHFDTDSDRLKPESAPTLKMVAAALDKNPNLKLEIDGYTDSVGDAQHNQELSQRRAEAVRQVLISQFKEDASRLTSAGFGPANPIGSNDTPDGRLQNRRVEFVKK